MDAKTIDEIWDDAIRSIGSTDHDAIVARPTEAAKQEFIDIIGVLRARYFNDPPSNVLLLAAGGIHVDGRSEDRELLWLLDVFNSGEVRLWRRSREAIEKSRRGRA